jgi:hypothetical protein
MQSQRAHLNFPDVIFIGLYNTMNIKPTNIICNSHNKDTQYKQYKYTHNDKAEPFYNNLIQFLIILLLHSIQEFNKPFRTISLSMSFCLGI